ncbi:helix-turn-helix domain-containing protein [Vallitalea longa]|uniref:helix-turn-helix domain-containing protein n=1 Tax=Vallitalea longa TaxID=2936439 RepID=UPI002493596E|nr:helix-turn-helix transcriptional regulator [Vallitalea longa]
MIGQRLRELREENGLIQKDIAKLLNITTSAYGYYEQEKNDIDTKTLIFLSDYYNVSTDYILGRTNISKPIEEFLKEKQIDEKLRDIIEEIDKSNQGKFNNKSVNSHTKKFLTKMLSDVCEVAGDLNDIKADALK